MRTIQFLDNDEIFLPWKYSEGERMFTDTHKDSPLVFNQEYLDKYVFSKPSFIELQKNNNLYVCHVLLNGKRSFLGGEEYDNDNICDEECWNKGSNIWINQSILRVTGISIEGCKATTKDCPNKLFDVMKESGTIDKCRIYIKNNFVIDSTAENIWDPDNFRWIKFFLCIDELEE